MAKDEIVPAIRVNIYLPMRMLNTGKLVLVALAVLGLGTPETLSKQITAISGYGEVLYAPLKATDCTA